jgi:urea carboxylase
MAFRERWSQEAMAKYKASVRPEATYLPDNVPYVAEINALEGGIDELKKIMFEASYMVFGLGDVYLGAPCAVPINPLHRSGTTSCHVKMSDLPARGCCAHPSLPDLANP